MKSLLFSLLALTAFTCGSLHAADDARLSRLQAADDARVAATVGGDEAKLTAILSEDLHYAHATGAVDTKASLIEAVKSGKLKYVSFDYEERKFTFPAPGIALMSGRTKVKVAKADGTTELHLTYLAVWREEKGEWHFLAWQSGKMPDPTQK